jgi:hypothetical protein
MPSYQNLTPPTSLFPGDVGFSSNNEAFPGGAQVGCQFALTTPGGYAPETGFTVRWQTVFGIAALGAHLAYRAEYEDRSIVLLKLLQVAQARYGLVSGGRLAGVGPAFAPARAEQAPPYNSSVRTPQFVTGMPLGEQIARQVSATDQTSRAIHYQRLEAEAKKFFRPAELPRRRQ